MPCPTPRGAHPAATRAVARFGSSGFTLLEAVAVLALLGILAALSAPALIPPRQEPHDPLQRVLDTTSRAAVRRAESLSLTVGTDGRWVIAREGGGGELLISGRLPAPSVPLRLRASPLGACWLESQPGAEAAPAIDPVGCRLAGAALP